jgi:PAS domain S-box-containing protein
MKLRSYLFSLALVALLPLLAFSGVMIVSIFLDHLKAVKAGLVDTSRAVSLAVDRKIIASIDTLSALASSDLLDANDLPRFRVQAERVLASHQTWSTLAVLDVAGRPVLELARPGASAQLLGDGSRMVSEGLAARGPAVSDLIEDGGARVVYVAVPVVRSGRADYVLVAGIEPPAVMGVLLEGGLPGDRLALLFDRKKTIVARSADSDQVAGKPAPAELARRSETSIDGSASNVRVDGGPVHVGFHRSELSGWTVATTVPVALVNGPLWRRLGLFLLVGAALIAVAVAGAWWFERRIRAPIVALSSAAETLARGGPVGALPRSSIMEIDSLARSIADADRLLRERALGWRQAETELADQRERFRVTLASIGDGVIATDELGRVTFMNDVALELTGQLKESALGQPLDAILPILDEETRGPIDGLFDRVMRQGLIAEGGQRTVIRSTAGNETPVECRGAPRRDAEGRTVGAVLVCRDASERRQAERERAEILARAHAARDEAEEANRAKDEFLAMLGHELRNPLGAISNALYVLELIGVQTPPAVQARQVVARGVEQLTRMVDDLLDVARVTRGKIALERRILNLADAVTQSLSGLSAAGRSTHHQITADVEPAWVDADPVRLQQIVANLIVNAIKYTPAGGTIHVTVGREGDLAMVRVADNGIGISAEMLPRVFEPFAQGDRTLERAPGGLGIGLTLARRLVEAHGGTIAAASEGAGRGSTFTVRLPLVAPPAEGAEPAGESKDPARRILLVEDGQDARDMLRLYLAQLGHQVYEAADGPSAVEAALRLTPDMALIDIGLPGLNGYEVARRIRAAPAGKQMYLVAVTGYGQPKDREQALASGFDDYLVKPFDRDRMAALLNGARRA